MSDLSSTVTTLNSKTTQIETKITPKSLGNVYVKNSSANLTIEAMENFRFLSISAFNFDYSVIYESAIIPVSIINFGTRKFNVSSNLSVTRNSSTSLTIATTDNIDRHVFITGV